MNTSKMEVAKTITADQLAVALPVWKPAHGKTIVELAGTDFVDPSSEWESLSHWKRVLKIWQDAIEMRFNPDEYNNSYSIETLRDMFEQDARNTRYKAVVDALYSVYTYGTVDEFNQTVDALEALIA